MLLHSAFHCLEAFPLARRVSTRFLALGPLNTSVARLVFSPQYWAVKREIIVVLLFLAYLKGKYVIFNNWRRLP